MQIRRSYVDGRWGQVHLRIAGDGRDRRPLLLLHPTPKSGWIWEPLMPVLGADRIVVAPDTPGYGASDPPPTPAAIEDLAQAMLDLLDALVAAGTLPAGSVDVMGYHTGSVIAAVMSRLAPDRIGRLVLVSLAAYPAEVRAEKLARLAGWPGPKDDGSHLTAMWALVGSLSDARADTGWRHASLTENLRSGARATWGYYGVFGHDVPATLDALTHPLMILNPEDDLWQPTRDHAPRVGHAHYVELPGTGHGLFDFDRDRIAGLVRTFLD